jgi:hypothetical protein
MDDPNQVALRTTTTDRVAAYANALGDVLDLD